MMHGGEKSDSVIVPGKLPNKTGRCRSRWHDGRARGRRAKRPNAGFPRSFVVGRPSKTEMAWAILPMLTSSTVWVVDAIGRVGIGDAVLVVGLGVHVAAGCR